MELTQNTAVRVPVRLVDAAGAPVTGILPADIQGGNAALKKADGTVSTIALTNGVNWFEVSAALLPGTYDLLLSAGNTNQLGPIIWGIFPSAAAFTSAGSVNTSTVVNYATAVWDALRSDHTAALSFGGLMRVLRQVVAGRVKGVVGTGVLTVYQEDNVTPLQTQNCTDAGGAPSILAAVERTAAP